MEKTNATKTRTDKRQNKNKATKHAKIQRFHKQKNNLIKTKNKKVIQSITYRKNGSTPNTEKKKTTKPSEEMNMKPIWNYAKNLTKTHKNKNPPIKNEDGTITQSLNEEHRRWKQWIQQNFYINEKANQPNITHVSEEQWNMFENKNEPQIIDTVKTQQTIHPDIEQIRKRIKTI